MNAETLEVVRQIQQLRDSLERKKNSNVNNDSSSMEETSPTNVSASESGTDASETDAVGTTAKATTTTATATAVDGATATATAADGSTATASSTPNGTAEAAAGGNPPDTMSEEKLIKLFLLMAGRGQGQDWPPGNGSAGGGVTSHRDASGAGAETDGAGSSSDGGPKNGGLGRGGREVSDADMEAAVAGFAAKMSIDAGMETPTNVAQGVMPAPPPPEEDKRGSWKGAMHLARLNEEKVRCGRETESRPMRVCFERLSCFPP